jgi:hypothetical protein
MGMAGKKARGKNGKGENVRQSIMERGIEGGPACTSRRGWQWRHVQCKDQVSMSIYPLPPLKYLPLRAYQEI